MSRRRAYQIPEAVYDMKLTEFGIEPPQEAVKPTIREMNAAKVHLFLVDAKALRDKAIEEQLEKLPKTMFRFMELYNILRFTHKQYLILALKYLLQRNTIIKDEEGFYFVR